jgi:uncharacterized iron-regulated protein
MTRSALTLAAVAATLILALHRPASVEAQDAVPVPQALTTDVRVHRVEYMRELWVALAHENVPADDLLAALRSVCDDTTAVAVVDVRVAAALAMSSAERATLRAAGQLQALESLKQSVGFDSRFTRLVCLGVFETAADALALARRNDTDIAGVMLLDPPVQELPQAERRGRMQVDVLLHSRSRQEFEAERDQLLEAMPGWNRSARVFEGTDRFADLEQRLRHLHGRVRGYTLLDAGEAASGAELARKLADFDVVIIGELHGNAGAHRLQLEFLREYVGDERPLALSTEQFERDVQGVLDAYLSGGITEDEFLARSRPWPNYADYRPLIELSREYGVPVLAGNIPRRLANRIFREGVEAFDEFTEEEKSWSARKLRADHGPYRDKFMRTMSQMGSGHGERLDSMYAAQAIKDDTMAESITDWLTANPGALVLHINGTFHSEGGLGVPEKLLDLMPELRIAVVSCIEPHREVPEAAEHEWLVRVPSTR